MPTHNRTATIVAIALSLCGAANASAQNQTLSPPDNPWSVEFAVGWDNSISGNINSSGVGRINDQPVVITKNTYESVYGTGLNLRFGGGYMLTDDSEVRASFTFQSLDADLTPMGEIGASRLYGQYDDYQALTLDFGYRRYRTITDDVRLYGEALIGLGFLDETDVTLVAPAANLSGEATDFYDKTVAFSLGVNAGVLMQMNDRVGVFAQAGFRRMSGMSEVDGLQGTGLEDINDKSSRWTIPFVFGIRARF